MARLTFSNVPTAGGGVISGNISTGPGSPFGAGGKYEAQVASIQATIAQAPPGFYDPVGWDKFLRESEQLGLEPTGIEDPEVMQTLLNDEPARRVIAELSIIRERYLGHMDRIEFRTSSDYRYDTGFGYVAGDKLVARINYLKEYIALSFDRVLKEKNAPLIQVLEEQKRQLEIDQTNKRCHFHHKGLECKSRNSRDNWSNRKVWPWSTQ